MFSVIVIVMQCLAIIFIGSFARSTSATLLNGGYLTSTLTLLLAFSLMYSPFKKLSLTTMVSLLLTIAIGVQSFILFGTFWDSCFRGFSNWFELNTLLLYRSLLCSIAILLTCLDFLGVFKYWQIYMLIAPIFTIGYALNSAVLNWGINIFDGGGGLQVFLFSGLVSLFIWGIVVRGNVQIQEHPKQESYFNRTLSLIGVVIALISWPQVNMAGATVSQINTILTDSSSLANSAIPNTFLGLLTALFTSMLLTSQGDQNKLRAQIYVNCFMNAGIVISSYSDVALNPVACIVITFLTTILTIFFYKYALTQEKSPNQTPTRSFSQVYAKIIFRLIMPFFGIIITSIVVATRWGLTPALLNNNSYSSRAGLQIAGFFITLAIGAFFGLIIAVVVKMYVSWRQGKTQDQKQTKVLVSIDDQYFFNQMYDQMFPIYPRSQQGKLPHPGEDTNRMLKMSLVGKTQKKQIKLEQHQTSNTMIPKQPEIKNQKLKDPPKQVPKQQIKQQTSSPAEKHARGIYVMSNTYNKNNIDNRQPKVEGRNSLVNPSIRLQPTMPNTQPHKNILLDFSNIKSNNYDSVHSQQSRKAEEEHIVNDDTHKIHIQDSAIVRKSKISEQTLKYAYEVHKPSNQISKEDTNFKPQDVVRRLQYQDDVKKEMQASKQSSFRQSQVPRRQET